MLGYRRWLKIRWRRDRVVPAPMDLVDVGVALLPLLGKDDLPIFKLSAPVGRAAALPAINAYASLFYLIPTRRDILSICFSVLVVVAARYPLAWVPSIVLHLTFHN